MLTTLKLPQSHVFNLLMLWTEQLGIFFSFRFDFIKSKT